MYMPAFYLVKMLVHINRAVCLYHKILGQQNYFFTLLNSTGLKMSILSEKSLWMLLRRFVSIGALQHTHYVSRQTN